MRTTKLANFLNPLYSSGHVRNDEGRGEDSYLGRDVFQ